MKKFSKILAAGFLAAAMIALPALLPGTGAEAASTKDN